MGSGQYYSDRFGPRGTEDLGGSYHFSRRTNLYAEIDFNRYQGAPAPASRQARQNGFGAGIMHMF